MVSSSGGVCLTKSRKFGTVGLVALIMLTCRELLDEFADKSVGGLSPGANVCSIPDNTEDADEYVFNTGGRLSVAGLGWACNGIAHPAVSPYPVTGLGSLNIVTFAV